MGCLLRFAIVFLLAESTMINFRVLARRMSSVAKAFEAHGVVPDVVPKAPAGDIKVNYPSGVEVNLGNELTPTQVKDVPTVSWDAKPDNYYVLAMTAIALLRPQYIYMRTPQQRPSVPSRFYDIAGFPRAFGAVDCTHIKISSAGGNRAELYRNRKGFFSVNVQAVCDAHLKIRSLIVRWPGSVHDTTIWNDSPLAAQFEQGRFGPYLILGDSGYPCLRYLMTPFLNPNTAALETYNRAQISTRNTIERCFGVLKKRYPCLHSGMQLK
ncbi:unnamed protein product [Euphydryas editha]|uniref:DDE Tnp4 domain-containing protein n=1 Tax=Euphydryas editha TaxID=104508 RepID=A0AAU9U8J3_EUPED|nr:unnamed protein product [Euphydryas editha]